MGTTVGGAGAGASFVQVRLGKPEQLVERHERREGRDAQLGCVFERPGVREMDDKVGERDEIFAKCAAVLDPEPCIGRLCGLSIVLNTSPVR
jgi:hypothetical protein